MGFRSFFVLTPWLESDRLAVGTALRRPEIAGFHLVDQLCAAEVGAQAIGHHDVVAATFQLVVDFGPEAGFEVDRQSRRDAPARCVGGRLRILLVVGETDHHLHVPLRLHRAAHHAEAHGRQPVLRDEAGNDGVERALARPDLVVVVVDQFEIVAAVLQADAGAGHDHARAEALVVRLDVRDHHAVGIGRSQVDRAAATRPAVAGTLRALHVDQLGALGEIRAVEQARHLGAHRRRVGDVSVDIGEGELHRFDLHVQAVGRVERQRGEVEVPQHAERHQRADALAVRADFMQGVTAIVEVDRLDPIALVRGEVFERHDAAVRFANTRRSCRLARHGRTRRLWSLRSA